MIEEWRPVVGYPEYEVSNLGNLRTYVFLHNKQVLKLKEPRPVKPFKDHYAFSPRVWIFRDGRMHHVCLRPLVLEAFIGLPKDGGKSRRTKHIFGKRGGFSAKLDEIAWSTDTPNASARRSLRHKKIMAIMRFRRRTMKRKRTLSTSFRFRVLEAVRAGGASHAIIARRLRITERQLRFRIYAACKRFTERRGSPDYWLDPAIHGKNRGHPRHDVETIRGVVAAVRRGEDYNGIAKRFGLNDRRAVAGIAYRARDRFRLKAGDPTLWLDTPPRSEVDKRLRRLAHARQEGGKLPVSQDTLRRSSRFNFGRSSNGASGEDGGGSDKRSPLPV